MVDFPAGQVGLQDGTAVGPALLKGGEILMPFGSWLVESKSSDYVSLTLKMMFEIWGPWFFMLFYPASALCV